MMLSITAGFYDLSRLPLAFLPSRLRYPSLLLIGAEFGSNLFSRGSVQSPV